LEPEPRLQGLPASRVLQSVLKKAMYLELAQLALAQLALARLALARLARARLELALRRLARLGRELLPLVQEQSAKLAVPSEQVLPEQVLPEQEDSVSTHAAWCATGRREHHNHNLALRLLQEQRRIHSLESLRTRTGPLEHN
jgi:hypothetical protein